METENKGKPVNLGLPGNWPLKWYVRHIRACAMCACVTNS